MRWRMPSLSITRFSARAVDEQGGTVFKTVGDGVCAAFQKPAAAVAAAVEGQRRLKAYPWPSAIGEIVVRMSIHTGAASAVDGDYFGGTLNRVARLMSLAHPGQILVSNASAALLGADLPAGVQLRTLGVFRLKDLSEPEPTSQVLADGLRPDFPVLASLDARPNNLPFQIASFVGRERELGEIEEQLGARRLITIVGPGGIGKTRLALQAAADAADRFPDGTWFVELSAVDDAALIAQAIAVVLKVREEAQRLLEDTLADAIGTKTMVVILDGVDRVLARAASLVKKLLSRCPSLQVVATSREPLHLTGERTVRLGALGEAAELFVERAREIDPEAMRSDGEHADTIKEICRRLDGIPLAIELAAANVATLSPPELLARLSKNLKLLVSRDTTKDERHRTLRAAISWSYDLLAPPEAAAACAFSVFEGSFDGAAASAVLEDDEDDTALLIDELVLKSMLTVVGGSRPARYAMMSTVRDYLRELTTDVSKLRERSLRHFRYFDRLVMPGGALPADNAQERRDRIDTDITNVRAALDFAVEAGLQESGAMAAALSDYWRARGFLSEGTGRFQARHRIAID
jgi:predicted ATPase